MKLTRLSNLFSPLRIKRCHDLFCFPWQVLWRLSGISKREGLCVTLKEGGSSLFYRRDASFWSWLFKQKDVSLHFTEEGEILVRHLKFSLTLRPGTSDMYIFSEIFAGDEYELFRSEKHLGTVVDLGANVGLFSSACAHKTKKIVAVEAISENHRQALKNFELNNIDTKHLYYRALAKTSGEPITIYRHNKNSGGHSRYGEYLDEYKTQSETVNSISLEDLFRECDVETVDLLKCDIEGSEYDVFNSAPDALFKKIKKMIIELHVGHELLPDQAKQLLEKIKANNFNCRLEPENIADNHEKACYVLYATRT